MAKQSDKELEAGLPKEFSNLKEKHPDVYLFSSKKRIIYRSS